MESPTRKSINLLIFPYVGNEIGKCLCGKLVKAYKDIDGWILYYYCKNCNTLFE